MAILEPYRVSFRERSETETSERRLAGVEGAAATSQINVVTNHMLA